MIPRAAAKGSTNVVSSAIDPHTQQKERDLRSLYAMAMVIAIGIMLVTFGATVFAFIYRSYLQQNWRPIVLPDVLWFSTAVLLASSAVLLVAQSRIKQGREAAFHRLAQVTVGLGLLFLGLQLAAWIQILRSGVLLDSNPHSSFIFIFSGIHGVHLLLGLAGLVYLLNRTREPVSGPKYRMTTRVWANSVGVFWHFLSLLWIVLYWLLLVWKR
jgi:cytochrome c oxidase subunit III